MQPLGQRLLHVSETAAERREPLNCHLEQFTIACLPGVQRGRFIDWNTDLTIIHRR